MASGSKKKQKLAALSGIGGVSDTALSSILAAIKEDPSVLDEGISRREIGREVMLAYDSVSTTLALPLKNGSVFEWSVAAPRLILPYLCEASEAFRRIMATVERRYSLILYVDEFTPGDPLHPETCRKTAGFYMAIKEFGPTLIGFTASWIPVACLRHEVLVTVAGGQSSVLRVLLESWFLGPHGIATAGIVFQFGDGPCIRYADLEHLLGDEEYLSQAWNINGANGLMCCFACSNMSCARSGLAGERIVEVSCWEPRRFHARTDEEAWESHAVLAELFVVRSIRGGIGRFNQSQTLTGFKYHPNDVLAARQLQAFIRPVSITTYDYMHCALANGHGNFAIGQFLLQAEEICKFHWDELREVANCNWEVPKQRRMRFVAEFFSLRRETATKSSGSFKATAGELLAVYPVVRFFAETELARRGGMEDQMASLLSICEVVDKFQEAKARIVTAPSLEDRITAHLQAFQRANPGVFLKPKGHLLYHCAWQILANDLLLDCFVCERKHQMMKRACFWIKRTTCFERTATARAFQETLRVLSNPAVFTNGLRGFTRIEAQSGILFGKHMQFDGVEYHADDCCFVQSVLLLIDGCMMWRDTCYLVVRAGALQDKVTPHASVWKFEDSFSKFRLGSCVTKHPMSWAWQDDGSLLVLH